MTRKPQKILYVGRRSGIPADLLRALRTAGYEVTTARSSLVSGLPDGDRAFNLVLSEASRAGPMASFSSRRFGKNPATSMTLRTLRESVGKTQAEMARKTAMSQPQLSRVEARRDHLTSTLRKYVRALGGDIEIIARVRDRWISLIEV
jgi:hypothetical protein